MGGQRRDHSPPVKPKPRRHIARAQVQRQVGHRISAAAQQPPARGRGHPHDWLLFAAAGHAHFVLDTPGQGSGWRPSETDDPAPAGGHPPLTGFHAPRVARPPASTAPRVSSPHQRTIEEHAANSPVGPRAADAVDGPIG